MDPRKKEKVASPEGKHNRTIIHFDYDCFYASVFENENPVLKNQPLAVQQKQIIVTCNYEARRRGLRKMQLIADAKKVCPEVIIVLGEDLTRFRNASKALYGFLQAQIWSGRAEKLGFDEVFLDCSDMIDYNVALLNHGDLAHSFFCLDQNDPTIGFDYDASQSSAPLHPPGGMGSSQSDDLHQRLVLGSHLARYLRHQLENEKGYTATVGISTNKVLSKLVGNVHKPNNQTTLMPPYSQTHDQRSNVTIFMDQFDIGLVPWIGFKSAHKIRARVLGRQPTFDEGLIWGGTKENITVRDVRTFAGMGPELLEDILGGPGSPKGIGGRIWELLHGIDPTEVRQAKKIPSQISLEDSYIRLDTFEQVKRELLVLSVSLIRRMHVDLTEDDNEAATEGENIQAHPRRRWLAHPRTLRLSTRPRPPLNPDGTRARSFNRISRSMPMPNFTFSLSENIGSLAEKLVQDVLIPAFRKLHPERSGWNLSLVNIAVTNMAETAADVKGSDGRDISRMFKRQDDVLREWRIADVDVAPDMIPAVGDDEKDDETGKEHSGEDLVGNIVEATEEFMVDSSMATSWDSDEDGHDGFEVCHRCGGRIPAFAMPAHERYHEMPD